MAKPCHDYETISKNEQNTKTKLSAAKSRMLSPDLGSSGQAPKKAAAATENELAAAAIA